MTRRPRLSAKNQKLDAFTEAARTLECDESEERFDAALRKIAAHKPPHKDGEAGAPKGEAKQAKETR